MIIDPVHCTELGCDCPGDRWWASWIWAVEIHLVPIDDSSPHLSEACACDPSLELHVVGDGYASWRVSHNSFDRRDLTEELLPDRRWPPPTL